MKAIKNRNPNVDIVEETPDEIIEPPTISVIKTTVQDKKTGLVRFTMPKADKQTLKVLEYNLTEI